MKLQTECTIGDVTIPVNIRYSRKDPYSLFFTFVGEKPVTWEVDRQLVQDGLYRMVGEGDVRFTPGGTTVGMRITSPSGSSLVVFLRDDLVAAVTKSLRELPFGSEPEMDWSKAADWFPGVIA